MFHPFRTVLASGALALALGGCSNLGSIPGVESFISPSVTTDPTALKPGVYSLDATHAFLDFSVNHMQLSELKGRFGQFDIALTVDEEDVTKSSVIVEIDMRTLFLSTEAFSQTLKGKDWFDTAAFPMATFTSTEITQTGDTTATISGLLSLHGKSAPVALDVVFHGGAYVPISGKHTIGFSATGHVKRSEFGVGKFTALVSDDVTLRFSGEFHKQ